jgi:cytochrome c
MGRGTRALLVAATCAVRINPAVAQFQVPALPPPDPATLFVNQCGVCHSLNPADPPRQGPLLRGVFDRPAGSLRGFKYSPGFATASFIWDEAHLDRWLTDPQGLIPGAVMLYKQADPKIRLAIIQYLKEQR